MTVDKLKERLSLLEKQKQTLTDQYTKSMAAAEEARQKMMMADGYILALNEIIDIESSEDVDATETFEADRIAELPEKP